MVAVPTDTLYGLAADVFNPDAIEKVFAIKERPEGLALPVLLSGPEQLRQVADDVPDQLEAVAEAFWPGAMTLIVKRNSSLPPRLTAGNPTVAVRVPDHPIPRELARRLGRPITGTSANISGAADPQSIAELRAQVGDRVDLLITGWPRTRRYGVYDRGPFRRCAAVNQGGSNPLYADQGPSRLPVN